jgi:hypothetical protein
MRIHTICLLAALSGCTWVSKADLDARKPELDDDGDGHPKETDCNDDNRNIYPGAEETWYDGIDADCGQDDDFDADKDGFVPDEWFGSKTEGVKGTGYLSGGDCNDLDESVNPSSVDTWYDGIDTDCFGNDDYDADNDGWVPRSVSYGETRHAEGTGTLGTGDCDDSNPLVHPGADDDWYDGVDSDCQGDDDCDQDGDGHHACGATYSATVYALDTTGDLPGGDCDDTVSDVNPSVEETWYDGLDSDCAGDDDYDQDSDGFYRAGVDYGPTTYASGTGLLLGGDCNDDPLSEGAASNPGALEILGDDVDHDCDALLGGPGPHSFRLTEIPDVIFTGVHDLTIKENDTNIWLGAATIQSEVPGDFIYYDSTWGYRLDAALPAEVEPTQEFIYTNSSDAIYIQTPGMGFLADDEMVVGVLGFLAPDAPSGPKRFFHLAGITPGLAKPSLGEGAFFGREDPWPAFGDLSLSRSTVDGSVHIVGCDDDPDGSILNYAYGTRESLELDEPTFSGDFQDLLSWEDFSASYCQIHTLDGAPILYSNMDGNFHAHTIDTDTALLTEIDISGGSGPDTGSDDTGSTLTSEVADLSPLDIFIPGRASSGWAVILDGGSGDIKVMRPDYTLAESVVPSGTASQVSAVFAPSGPTLYLAYVLDTGAAFLTWGDPEEGFVPPIPVFSTFGVTEIAIWVDASTGDQLVVGVIGESDEVAYGIARIDGD